MDPSGILSSIISVANYLYAASEKMKENREECRRLCKDVNTIVNLITKECKTGMPPNLKTRLAKLENTLSDIASAVEELSKRSFLQRALWRESISSKIQVAYRDISDAMRELNLGVSIDLCKFQYENEQARRMDTSEAMQQFAAILSNGSNILSELQVHKWDMQQAMVSLHRHIVSLPKTIERRFFENGMHALQRCSGRLVTEPDEFALTSLDVIVHRHKRLGQGGFATVYEGDWKGTRVAVKELEKGVPSSLIQREIDVWKRLRHPHVLEFFGSCSIADPPFIVCALKEHGDIIDYLNKYPNANRRRLLHDASTGLEYLHAHNVIHGDLKGTNILIDARGRACLSDFGLSKIRVHSSTRTRRVSSDRPQTANGTVHWMSPESLSLGAVNKKTDIYSFGMTMYEVFSGLPPFASTPESMLLSVICDRAMRPLRPDDPEAASSGLDDAMWQLITTCWAQDAKDRCDAGHITKSLDVHHDNRFLSVPGGDYQFSAPSPQGVRSTGTQYSTAHSYKTVTPQTRRSPQPMEATPRRHSANANTSALSSSTTTSDTATTSPYVTANNIIETPGSQLRAAAKEFAEKELDNYLERSVQRRSARQQEVETLEYKLNSDTDASEFERQGWQSRLLDLKKQQKDGIFGRVGPYVDMLCNFVLDLDEDSAPAQQSSVNQAPARPHSRAGPGAVDSRTVVRSYN